jgi:nicotinic acid mononucleotide adenylyltransferase
MDKSIVIGFGRFNPPTTGHRLLLDVLKTEAAKRKADLLVFPSQSHDVVTARTRVQPKNPLPFDEKLRFLETLFPDVEFSGDTRIKTPVDALMACSRAGYDSVSVVVGSDRVKDFEVFRKYIKPKGNRNTDIILKNFEVVAVPANRDPDAEGVSGMSASKMRAFAVDDNFKGFREGVPTKNERVAKQLFNTVRKHMKLTESTQHAFLLYGPPTASLAEAVRDVTTMPELTPRDILLRTQAFQSVLSSKLPFAVDVANESYVTIHHVHGILESSEIVPTVYVCPSRGRIITEGGIQHMTTSGLIKRGLARDTVEVASAGHMIQHMIDVMEAEVRKTKVGMQAPTEVDRLKADQKQQEIMLKQRQSQELLQAKMRELQKKTRDDMNKIKTGEKPTASPEK